MGFSGFSAGVKQITLAVGPLYGARWLTPRLGHWYAQYLQFVLTLHHAEPIRHAHQLQATAAIARGDGHWQGLQSQRLLDCWFAPVLSPTLLEQNAGLAVAADLARYPVVHQQTLADWSAWMAQAEAGSVLVLHESVMADSNMAI